MSDTVAPRRGMTAYILSPAGPSCSNRGISARYPQVTIVGVRAHCSETANGRPLSADIRDAVDAGDAELPRIFAAGPNSAEVELVLRRLGGGLYVHAEPVEGGGRWAMAGGTFIHTSDSRWGDILRAIYGDDRYQVGPVPLHDRYEH